MNKLKYQETHLVDYERVAISTLDILGEARRYFVDTNPYQIGPVWQLCTERWKKCIGENSRQGSHETPMHMVHSCDLTAEAEIRCIANTINKP